MAVLSVPVVFIKKYPQLALFFDILALLFYLVNIFYMLLVYFQKINGGGITNLKYIGLFFTFL
jgi:hypothetical protein